MAADRRRATSADVAEASGVSRATVSYVLNGVANQAISAETARRVREAADRLGYAPSAPARALRSGRSDVILFLIPEWPIGSAIASLIEHLYVRLAETNLTLVVHAHPRSARPVSDLWKAITPAAVINHQALSAAEEAAARRAGMLIVTPVFQPHGGKTFLPFQRRIGELQVQHLVRRPPPTGVRPPRRRPAARVQHPATGGRDASVRPVRAAQTGRAGGPA